MLSFLVWTDGLNDESESDLQKKDYPSKTIDLPCFRWFVGSPDVKENGTDKNASTGNEEEQNSEADSRSDGKPCVAKLCVAGVTKNGRTLNARWRSAVRASKS